MSLGLLLPKICITLPFYGPPKGRHDTRTVPFRFVFLAAAENFASGMCMFMERIRWWCSGRARDGSSQFATPYKLPRIGISCVPTLLVRKLVFNASKGRSKFVLNCWQTLLKFINYCGRDVRLIRVRSDCWWFVITDKGKMRQRKITKPRNGKKDTLPVVLLANKQYCGLLNAHQRHCCCCCRAEKEVQ